MHLKILNVLPQEMVEIDCNRHTSKIVIFLEKIEIFSLENKQWLPFVPF